MPRRTRPRRRPARKGRKTRVPRGIRSGALNVKHYARIVETIPWTQATVVGTVGEFNYSFDISYFERAKALAECFKYVRAKRCVWRYLPVANTFQGGAPGSRELPTFSFIMNRTGDMTPWTLAEYDAQGAVPQTFTKMKQIAYKPNLTQSLITCTQGYVAGNTAQAAFFSLGSTPKYDLWIGTGLYNQEINPPGFAPAPAPANDVSDQARYQGHAIHWTATGAVDGQLIANVFLEVEWEFKDPLFVYPPKPGQEAPVNTETVTSV